MDPTTALDIYTKKILSKPIDPLHSIPIQGKDYVPGAILVLVKLYPNEQTCAWPVGMVCTLFGIQRPNALSIGVSHWVSRYDPPSPEKLILIVNKLRDDIDVPDFIAVPSTHLAEWTPTPAQIIRQSRISKTIHFRG